jgi:tyrosine-protein kinase
MNTWPVVGESVPATQRSSVVFPDPLGPTRASRSPASSVMSTDRTTSRSPKRRETRSTDRRLGFTRDEASALRRAARLACALTPCLLPSLVDSGRLWSRAGQVGVGRELSTDFTQFLQTLRRRLWLLVLPIVLLPAATYYFTNQQAKVYEASAQVLLSRQNLPALISGIPDYSFYDPSVAQTQAAIATVPVVAQRTLHAAGVTNMTPGELLGNTRVTPQTDTDLLTFTVRDGDPARAALLATAYARQYTLYRRDLDTAQIKRALADLDGRLQDLAAAGKARSPAYRSLVSRQQQLQTLEALQTSNASLVRTASGAAQVEPKPSRNAFVGLAVGLILGIGLVVLGDALDTRVRSAEDIEHRLGLPLLARLSEPPRRVQRRNKLVMVEEPSGHQAESFRMLRTNIEFLNLDRHARVIMVTSAVDREGKSTTIANLAVAAARTGRRVVLVDLDLRRPALHQFFGFSGREGLTSVALGQASLDDVIKYVAVEPELSTHRRSAAGNGNGTGAIEGVLQLLLTGPAPPAAGEFAASEAVGEILDDLRERADLVLVDAPPLLQVGDAINLAARVDALFLVARLRTMRRPILKELARVLESCPAAKLGFVLTGAKFEEGYGYAAYRGVTRRTERESERVT